MEVLMVRAMLADGTEIQLIRRVADKSLDEEKKLKELSDKVIRMIPYLPSDS